MQEVRKMEKKWSDFKAYFIEGYYTYFEERKLFIRQKS
jgi:hypothetical protein